MKCMICKTPYQEGEKRCKVCRFELCKDIVSHSTLDEISAEDRAYYAEVEVRYLKQRLAWISAENSPGRNYGVEEQTVGRDKNDPKGEYDYRNDQSTEDNYRYVVPDTDYRQRSMLEQTYDSRPGNDDRFAVPEERWQKQNISPSMKKDAGKSVNTAAGFFGMVAVILLLVLVGIGMEENRPKYEAPAPEAYVEEKTIPTVTAEPAVSEGPEVTEEITEAPGSTGKQSSNYAAAEIGDEIQFGAYWQDARTENGKKAIDWIVLDKTEGQMLVISKYALDAKPYNTKYTDVTWETCTLRKWMNEDFLSEAFTEEEARKIALVDVTADKNPEYDTNPGNDTQDKVFLLSIQEANRYFSDNGARMCVPTEYAISNGAWTSDNYSVGGKATCWCWLRSPGFDSSDAAYVGSVGGVGHGGYYVGDGHLCVRPALWIDLKS